MLTTDSLILLPTIKRKFTQSQLEAYMRLLSIFYCVTECDLSNFIRDLRMKCTIQIKPLSVNQQITFNDSHVNFA